MLFDLAFFTDIGLLALRLIVAIVFFSSGKSHAEKPEERGESIGMSPGLTRVLGILEMAAAISVGFGIYIQLGALIIIAVMLGAIYKKIFEWETGFYADKGFGWHYDAIFLAAAVVFLGTGGRWVVV